MQYTRHPLGGRSLGGRSPGRSLQDQCRSIKDFTTANILESLIERVESLEAKLAEQNKYQCTLEKWVCRCVKFESERDINCYVRDFNLSQQAERRLYTEYRARFPQKNEPKKMSDKQPIAEPKPTRLVNPINDILDSDSCVASVEWLEVDTEYNPPIPSKSADIPSQNQNKINYGAKPFIPKKTNSTTPFMYATPYTYRKKTRLDMVKSTPIESQSSEASHDRLKYKYEPGRTSEQASTPSAVPDKGTPTVVPEIHAMKHIPRSRKMDMSIELDEKSKNLLDVYGKTIKEITKTVDSLNLVYSGTSIAGLEKSLEISNTIVVVETESSLFGFKVLSSKELMIFSLKNPFDICPVLFEHTNPADYSVNINAKQQILEVWHFLRVTGTTGYIFEDFNDYYTEPTSVGADIVVGVHQPDTFTVSHYYAFTT